MGVHSGMWGVLNGVSTVRNWSITEVGDTKAYVASNTRGGTGRRPGNVDWNGNFNGYGGEPAVLPGEAFAFAGYTAPNDDAEGSDGSRYAGTSILDQVVINWNWEAGDIIQYASTFSSNGALSQSADGLYSDATAPDAPSVIGCEVRVQNVTDAASGVVTLDDVVSASLTITAANKPYVNSSTSGQTLRKPGPIDWTLQLNLQNDDRLTLPMDVNDEVVVEIDIEAGGTYWSLSYGLVKEFSGLTVDRETGNIVACTIPINMAAYSHVDAAIGAIVKPSGGTYWPAP